MLVVQFLTKPLYECHSFGNLIDGSLTLINEDWVIEIRHIFQEGNIYADHLTKLTQSFNMGLAWLVTP
ncbi:hypothetical protein Godav_010956 [Gossypium davidsonii]|uniref:RNase H type-1 domain-containing protein n=1 Tax=Gossypium davidsonii TaxID=34287 RepID=A0A7J8R898_GOSDV|nr:hypothetical protein [Gossypium davidsonii]